MKKETVKELVEVLVAMATVGAKVLEQFGDDENTKQDAAPAKEKKASKKAAPAPEPEPEEDEMEDLGDVGGEEETVTDVMVREQLVRIAGVHGKDKAYELLAKHGGKAKKIADVKPELLSTVYKELKKVK